MRFLGQILSGARRNGRHAQLMTFLKKEGVEEIGVIPLPAQHPTEPVDSRCRAAIGQSVFQIVENRRIQECLSRFSERFYF